MNFEEFWKIIDTVKVGTDTNMDAKTEALTKRLQSMDTEAVLSFSHIFDSLMDKAYTWDLWAAAYIIQGGCSDDGFMDFRSSLISMGKEVYEQVVSSPEKLADISPSIVNCLSFEGFAYPSTTVYKDKSGELPQRSTPCPIEPTGEPWEEDEDILQAKYPKLWGKYGESPADGYQESSIQEKPWWKFW